MWSSRMLEPVKPSSIFPKNNTQQQQQQQQRDSLQLVEFNI